MPFNTKLIPFYHIKLAGEIEVPLIMILYQNLQINHGYFWNSAFAWYFHLVGAVWFRFVKLNDRTANKYVECHSWYGATKPNRTKPKKKNYHDLLEMSRFNDVLSLRIRSVVKMVGYWLFRYQTGSLCENKVIRCGFVLDFFHVYVHYKWNRIRWPLWW